MNFKPIPAFLLALIPTSAASQAERIAPLTHAELNHLLSIIKPQAGESPWREINWITNVTEARKRAITEDKPIVIFTAADGSPIGRT